MNLLTLFVLVLVSAACGALEKEEGEAKEAAATASPSPDVVSSPSPTATPTPAPVNEGRVKLDIFGRDLWADDDLFALSCDDLALKFIVTERTGECEPVETATTPGETFGGRPMISWSIMSSDHIEVNLNGIQIVGENTIAFAFQKYHCYSYKGAVYDTAGVAFEHGSFLLFGADPADKPSEVGPEDVLAIGFSDASACDALGPEKKSD